MLPGPQTRGQGGPLQFPRQPSDRSTPNAPGGSSAPAPGSLVPSMAFAHPTRARLLLGPANAGVYVTTLQASASLEHDRLHGHRTRRIRGSSCDGVASITCKFAKRDGSLPDWSSLMLRLTRWTIAHRRLVVVAWVLLAVGVLVVSQAVGKRDANNFSLPNTDSQRAIDLLESRFPTQAGDADQIAFRTRDGKLGDASARAVIVPLLGRIARLPHVAGVVSPYAAGANSVSSDGTIGFATVEFDQRAKDLPRAAIE